MTLSCQERRFRELLEGIKERESYTLVIAAVASSAYLILLGSGIQRTPWGYVAGVLFPLLGSFYRKLTTFSENLLDTLELRGIMGFQREDSRRWTLAIHIRRVLVRFLLVFPSAVWIAAFSSPGPIPFTDIVAPTISFRLSSFVILMAAVFLELMEWRFVDKGKPMRPNYAPFWGSASPPTSPENLNSKEAPDSKK